MRAKWIVQVELHKAQARLATAANDAEVKAAQAEVGKLLEELAERHRSGTTVTSTPAGRVQSVRRS